jgi:hypothetical protein
MLENGQAPAKPFQEVKAPPEVRGVTVITHIKDELFYLRAFLDHYRRIGVSRFVFLDDGSTDGGFEYLLQQPDCGMVTSELHYDQFVDGKRAETIWRSSMAKTYCDGRWAAVVDVDEFIVLPPSIESLTDFTHQLDAMGAGVIGAAMIDFYPANIADLEDASPPKDAEELFARYPYFDDCPHGRWKRGRFWRAYGGTRSRLLMAHGFEESPRRKSWEEFIRSTWLRLTGRSKPPGLGAIQKVPLVRWAPGYEYVHPHSLNVAPRDDVQLPLAHFKFTGSFSEKIAQSITRSSYLAHNYTMFCGLVEAMRRAGGSFLCDVSRKYSGSQDFVESELIRFPGLARRRRWSFFSH